MDGVASRHSWIYWFTWCSSISVSLHHLALLSSLLVSFSSTFAPGGSKTPGSTGLQSSQYGGKIVYPLVHVTFADHLDWLSKTREHERPSAWPWGKRREAISCQLGEGGDNPWRETMLNGQNLTGVYLSVHLKACKTGRARTETYFLNGRPALFWRLYMN